jgi:uncharacterized damage-inducible protein DinB
MTDDGFGTHNGTRYGITEPAHLGDERTALLGFLQRQRELVVWKVRQASDDVLRSAVTPTGLSIHGLVRHLENVERHWIRHTFADQHDLSFDWTDEDPDRELHVPVDIGIDQLTAAYQAETALCDAVIAAAELEDVSAHRSFSLRWIVLHLIEETSRHLGHLDLLRELADGQVGEEP